MHWCPTRGWLIWDGHCAVREREAFIVRQLANLGALPTSGFKVGFFPIAIVGATAGPARGDGVHRLTLEDRMDQSSASRLAECLERARALESVITEHAAELSAVNFSVSIIITENSILLGSRPSSSAIFLIAESTPVPSRYSGHPGTVRLRSARLVSRSTSDRARQAKSAAPVSAPAWARVSPGEVHDLAVVSSTKCAKSRPIRADAASAA